MTLTFAPRKFRETGRRSVICSVVQESQSLYLFVRVGYDVSCWTFKSAFAWIKLADSLKLLNMSPKQLNPDWSGWPWRHWCPAHGPSPCDWYGRCCSDSNLAIEACALIFAVKFRVSALGRVTKATIEIEGAVTTLSVKDQRKSSQIATISY